MVHNFERNIPTWTRKRRDLMNTILVPKALSFLLAGLARENGGLCGHRIFELIRIFLIGCLEQRIPKRKSKNQSRKSR